MQSSKTNFQGNFGEIFHNSYREFIDFYFKYTIDHKNNYEYLLEEIDNISISIYLSVDHNYSIIKLSQIINNIHDLFLKEKDWNEYLDLLSFIEKKCNSLSSNDKVFLKVLQVEILIKLGDYKKSEKYIKAIQNKKPDELINKVLIKASLLQATILLRKGLYEAAENQLIRILDLYGKEFDYIKPRIFVQLANIYRVTGKQKSAKSLLRKAKRYYLRYKDFNYLAGVYNSIGLIERNCSRFNNSIEYFYVSIDLFRRESNNSALATTLCNLGFTYWQIGNFNKSMDVLDQSIRLASNLGFIRLLATAYGNFGLVLLYMGDFSKAKYYIKQQIHISKKIGDTIEESRGYGNLGILYYFGKDSKKAIRYLEIDKKQLEASGILHSQVYAYNLAFLGLSYLKEDNERSGVDFLEQSLSIAKTINSKAVEIIALRGIAKLKREEELILLRKSLRIARSINSKFEIAICQIQIANYYRKKNKDFKKILIQSERLLEQVGAKYSIDELITIFE